MTERERDQGSSDKPSASEIEAFRRENIIHAHVGETPAAGLEPWAIQSNRVLNYLCDLGTRSAGTASTEAVVMPIINNNHEWPRLTADVTGMDAIRWKGADGSYRWMLHAEAISGKTVTLSARAPFSAAAMSLARQVIGLHELNRDGVSGRVEPAEVTLAKAIIKTADSNAKP